MHLRSGMTKASMSRPGRISTSNLEVADQLIDGSPMRAGNTGAAVLEVSNSSRSDLWPSNRAGRPRPRTASGWRRATARMPAKPNEASAVPLRSGLDRDVAAEARHCRARSGRRSRWWRCGAIDMPSLNARRRAHLGHVHVGGVGGEDAELGGGRRAIDRCDPEQAGLAPPARSIGCRLVPFSATLISNWLPGPVVRAGSCAVTWV